MRFFYVFLFMIFTFMVSCDPENTTNSNASTPEMSIQFLPIINNTNIKQGQYYSFLNGDSILISRLDFYVQHTEIFNKSQNKKSNFDTVILVSLNNSENKILMRKSDMPTTIDSIQFLCGLDDFTNAMDPNKYANNHPLSSWKNMYWTWSSKYRFIVFEGSIKSPSGSISNFSYHTGLNYKYFGSLPLSITLNTSNPKTYSLKLDIKKIFYPSEARKIDYSAGELQAHADPSDLTLTDKFAKNFAAAFSFE